MKLFKLTRRITITLLLATVVIVSNSQNSTFYQVSEQTGDGFKLTCTLGSQIDGSVFPVCYIAIPSGKNVVANVNRISFGESYLITGHLRDEFITGQNICSIRDQEILVMKIKPILRISKSKSLPVTELQVNIRFENKQMPIQQRQFRSPLWDGFIQNLVVNPWDIEQPGWHNPSSRDDGAEYLIIASDIFIPGLDGLKEFRIQQGISTMVVGTSETGTTTGEIQDYITEAYNTWTIPPAAVMLVGDYGLLPSPIWDAYCVSDNIYADVNMDDLPDIFISRIPANTLAELEVVIQKVINYETDPPAYDAYYNHPLACTDYTNHYKSSWMVSEILNGWYENELGKSPARQYVGSVPGPTVWPDTALLQIFGPQGFGYIPATPEYISNYTGGNAQGINNNLNSGAFTFLSYDQGMETGWASPAYNIDDLPGLTTADPTYLFSINDLNGKFNNVGGDCMAEAFLKHPHGGLGVIAPSEITYSFITSWYTIGLLDGLWDDFYPGLSSRNQDGFVRPCMANAYAKYFVQMLGLPFNPSVKETIYHEFHYFGEPFSMIYDQLPVDLTVEHENCLIPGQQVFEVTADQDATVALVLNNQICSVAISEGIPLQMPLITPENGNTLHITVTKQNCIRYHAEVICSSGVGVNDVGSVDVISVFPNPANGQVNISFNKRIISESEIIITDLSGKRIRQFRGFIIDPAKQQICLPLGNLENGMYILKVVTGEGVVTTKLAIQNH
nr:T9SS type A sorting domain-containing protein [Bacteroidota bacterium]